MRGPYHDHEVAFRTFINSSYNDLRRTPLMKIEEWVCVFCHFRGDGTQVGIHMNEIHGLFGTPSGRDGYQWMMKQRVIHRKSNNERV